MSHEFSSGCAVATQNLVYAWTKSREEFERIDLPESVHDWAFSDVESLIMADGKKYERRVHYKSMFDSKVYVIFQWFEVRELVSDLLVGQ